ncbi:hypothetical protein PYW08_001360 [Mythimna loreyi]|uniref:Uncharacterized protein n=1 Tax=Mythimna loreyi TaxID=667449 RepID=A0ACC2R1D5_9NEOP|nr:hypothetical protein PYW08_001360 [Mythimna loreyi]
MFSTFFTSVYEPTNFDPAMWQPPNTYADNSPYISEVYLPVDVIHNAIQQFNLNKGPGPDVLPPLFIKKTTDIIVHPLLVIFNKCLREGTFPNIWKRAHYHTDIQEW